MKERGGAGGGVPKRAALFFLVFQVVFIVFFAVFVEHDGSGTTDGHATSPGGRSDRDQGTKFDVGAYAAFQDVHVMIFVGFGFLMTFLSRYSYSSVCFNLLLSAVAVQWSILCQGFFHAHHTGHSHIVLKLSNILTADIATASFLISFGVVLGRLTPNQLLLMVALQMPLFAANEHLVYAVLKATDVGGSIVVHLFGAIFGLAISVVMTLRDRRSYAQPSPSLDNDRTSNVFSMVGTLFLWIFWPSFNAALANPGVEQQRAVVNTYLSISASVVTAFAVSFLVSHEKKLEMEHIQNSTLAGGVAIGAIADQVTGPAVALAVGSTIGIISVLGFRYIRPLHQNKTSVLDSCGVMHLHGIPGLVSGLISCVLYVAQAAPNLSTNGQPVSAPSPSVKSLVQLQAVGATCGIALVGGILTGLALTLPLWKRLEKAHWYEDAAYFEGVEMSEDDDTLPTTVKSLTGESTTESSPRPAAAVGKIGLPRIV